MGVSKNKEINLGQTFDQGDRYRRVNLQWTGELIITIEYYGQKATLPFEILL